MPKTVCAASAFTAWMQLRLSEDEHDFDHDLLDTCQRIVLTQAITSDLVAIQVATVVQATIEDGESSDRLAIHAMAQLIDYIAGRADQKKDNFVDCVISEQLHCSSTQ